jgi:hypothetical protein
MKRWATLKCEGETWQEKALNKGVQSPHSLRKRLKRGPLCGTAPGHGHKWSCRCGSIKKEIDIRKKIIRHTPYASRRTIDRNKETTAYQGAAGYAEMKEKRYEQNQV